MEEIKVISKQFNQKDVLQLSEDEVRDVVQKYQKGGTIVKSFTVTIPADLLSGGTIYKSDGSRQTFTSAGGTFTNVIEMMFDVGSGGIMIDGEAVCITGNGAQYGMQCSVGSDTSAYVRPLSNIDIVLF